ncbi:MAG: glycosyltransferase family A protein [Ginsengibacter sp.]
MITEYIIVSTARDEEKLIQLTLDSVIAQSIRPAEYIIVNDGSKDSTGEIINKYSQLYPWIRTVDLADRGYYQYGSGIIQAFYAGLEKIDFKNYKVLVKLDCDLSFDKFYFENLLRELSDNPELGIVSGQTYCKGKNNKLIWEDAPLDHTVGPSKVYRRECFEEINGLIVSLGWDHVDEVVARMKGWRTKSYPAFQLLHHRSMGSRLGKLRGYVRHGRADYITGYHPAYFFAKTVYRLFSPPFVIGSIASFWGFAMPFVLNKKRIVHRQFIKHYRKEQLRKLTQKKFYSLYLHKYKLSKPREIS